VGNELVRAFVASKFVFVLDGMGSCGFLNSVEGAGLKTDVQDYKQGPKVDVWRQVGRPKFDDISLKVGMGMSSDFYAWISDFFNRKVTRKNGSIVAADFNYQERARRSFTDALISEVGFPALDGGSKEAAFMTVKLVPEAMTYETIENGSKIESPENLKQPNKLWHAANFDFTIDGLQDSLKRVMKIDAFTIKQQILEYPWGGARLPMRVPGRLEYPNLNIYVPSVDADKLTEAAQARLLDYDKPTEGGLTGALTLRAPDKSTLCTINLTGVDIVSTEAQKLEASAESIYMVKVAVQCEAMTFKYEGKEEPATAQSA
jgi:phage tail-like protein